MAKLVLIHCSDCGWPRLTARRNTKYCYVCRLERNLAFIGDRMFKCIDCGNRRNQVIRNEEMCKVCDTFSTPENVVGQCGVCGEHEQRLLGDTVHICVKCIHDPAKRETIRVQLKRKREAIQKGEIPIPSDEEVWAGADFWEKPDEVILAEATPEQIEMAKRI